MHGYGMVGDLLHLGLYLLTIGLWALLWVVCIFNARSHLKKLLGAHAVLVCVLLFPVLPVALIGGALLVFGLEGIFWSLCLAGVGLPLAGLRIFRRYVRVNRMQGS